MEKSNVEKVKDALLYAPVGAFGFVRDNAPTFFSMFVSRGRRDVTKGTIQAEEKIASTKNHGQIVAMGSPIAKDKAENLAGEAKQKGEEIAELTAGLAVTAFGFADNAVRGLLSSLTSSETTPDKETKAEADDTTEDEQEEESVEPTMTPETIDNSTSDTAYAYSEDGFIAEPINPNVKLPTDIKAIYERLSAPEIIDRLDDYTTNDLDSIRNYESGFRNRQTIIHAINYRLDDY